MVPIGGIKTTATITPNFVEIANRYFIIDQVHPLIVQHFILRNLGLNAIQNGNGINGGAVVVAPEHHFVVGIGTNHRNFLSSVFVEWKHIVLVVQQGHGLLSHLIGQLLMLLTVQYRGGNLCPGHQLVVVHVAQIKTAKQHTHQTSIDVLLANQVLFYRLREQFIVVIVPDTFHIGTRHYATCCSVHRC